MKQIINIVQVIVKYLLKNKITPKAKLIALSVIVTFMVSCEDDYFYYDTNNAILQFGPELERIYNSNYNLADTAKSFTFVYEDPSVMQDTAFLDLYAIGGPTDTDRPFAIKQVIVDDTLNAEPGVHYIPFNDPSVSGLYVIKTGQVHLRVPIVLLRDESLKNATYVLKIELEGNDYFSLGDPDLLWRKLYSSDQVTRPNLWNSTMEKYYFGKYSKVKHRFLIEQTGEKWDDEFFTALRADSGYMYYWKTKAKTALSDYNNEHPDDPLRDEDGELVVFP
ncbi:MAG: DUF4843 domain-containing protein [Draconibacterium sp.]